MGRLKDFLARALRCNLGKALLLPLLAWLLK
jgi:hypothetical protein